MLTQAKRYRLALPLTCNMIGARLLVRLSLGEPVVWGKRGPGHEQYESATKPRADRSAILSQRVYRNGSARHANLASVIETQPKSQAGLPVSEEEFCLRKSRRLSRRSRKIWASKPRPMISPRWTGTTVLRPSG